MKEVVGNIWDYHKQGHWIVITTNGSVKSNGNAVMGRGIALQAKSRFLLLAYDLGIHIRCNGNILGVFPSYKLMTFPVKYNWWEGASLELIKSSCKELVQFSDIAKKIYMVRPGCSNGGLDWKDVKPILEKYLDDRFVVVEVK